MIDYEHTRAVLVDIRVGLDYILGKLDPDFYAQTNDSVRLVAMEAFADLELASFKLKMLVARDDDVGGK